MLSRRSFLTIAAAFPWALKARALASIPLGLELYSVRGDLKRDPFGTVRAVGEMGYQCVEFYAPYFDWDESQAKQMRKLLDDLGMRCYSTHNNREHFDPKNLPRARDLNLIMGSKYMVLAWSDPKSNADDWKKLANDLNTAADQLASSGLTPGYHNHQTEFITTRRAPDGYPGEEHQAVHHAATRRRHLP
jgi:sugar phosphate isomerase/epimerase